MILPVRGCIGKTEVPIYISYRTGKTIDTNHITNQFKQKTIGQQKMCLLQKLNQNLLFHVTLFEL
jgi:hypothetical protein